MMSLGYLVCNHHAHIAPNRSTLQKVFLAQATIEFAPSVLPLYHVIVRIRRSLPIMDGIMLPTFGWSFKAPSLLNI